MSVGFLFTQKGVAMEKVLRRLVMKELTNEYNKWQSKVQAERWVLVMHGLCFYEYVMILN
jgi:hypothetical protein